MIFTQGMPAGSPGPEVTGTTPQPFEVIAFDKSGQTEVFATYVFVKPKEDRRLLTVIPTAICRAVCGTAGHRHRSTGHWLSINGPVPVSRKMRLDEKPSPALVESIRLSKTLPCLAEPGKLIVIGKPNCLLDEVLPYLATLPGVIAYNPDVRTLTFRRTPGFLTLYPDKVYITPR